MAVARTSNMSLNDYVWIAIIDEEGEVFTNVYREVDAARKYLVDETVEFIRQEYGEYENQTLADMLAEAENDDAVRLDKCLEFIYDHDLIGEFWIGLRYEKIREN